MSQKSLSDIHQSVATENKSSSWRRLLAFSGPAYLVSVGYMDPGNWATDIAGGSAFGYKLLWVLLMSNLMAILLQSLAARLGIVTGVDLAKASRQSFPASLNMVLYVLAQIAIIACDLAEVLGFAIGLKLLFGFSLLLGVLISLLDTFLILALQRYGVRRLEAFIITLVAIIGFSFLLELMLAKPDLDAVVGGLVPSSLHGSSLFIAIGILGATVMPHNLYLHTALVQTRKFDNDEAGIKRALRFNFIDSVIALNLAFLVNAAILILAASTFYQNGMSNVASIEQAHALLNHLLGSRLAPILFAVALIAAGQSSTVTGTLAGQIVMEGYLNLKMKPWLRRLLTRSIAILPAIVVLIWFGEGAINELLIGSQVVLSMQLGFAIVPLILFVSNKKRMGVFAIRPIWQIISWIVATVIIGLNLLLLYNYFIS